MNIRRTARAILTRPIPIRAILIRLVIMLGILIAFTLFINLPWFDEELHKDLLDLNAPRDFLVEGNAYPLFRGFLAAADRDPREAGLRIIRTMQQRSRAGEPARLTNEEVDEILGHPSKVKAWRHGLRSSSCNYRIEKGLDCLDRVIAEATDANLDKPELRLLLNRYEQLLQAPRWEEFQELDHNSLSVPEPWGDLSEISRIRLVQSMRTNTTTRFLQDISGDIRFWKRILDGGHWMISKMIAADFLRRDAMFLSTFMRTRKLSAEELRGMSAVLAPLTESERNIEDAFMGDLRFAGIGSRSVLDSVGGRWSWLQPVLQENATANEIYVTHTLPLRLRASLSAAEFYRQRAYKPFRVKELRFMPPPLYNLGGKLLLRKYFGYDILSDQISRVHDNDGRIALVLLQAEVALNADRSVQDVVNESRYRNPYTGEPMHYDSKKGTISFRCLAPGGDVCAVKIR